MIEHDYLRYAYNWFKYTGTVSNVGVPVTQVISLLVNMFPWWWIMHGNYFLFLFPRFTSIENRGVPGDFPTHDNFFFQLDVLNVVFFSWSLLQLLQYIVYWHKKFPDNFMTGQKWSCVKAVPFTQFVRLAGLYKPFIHVKSFLDWKCFSQEGGQCALFINT